MDIIKSTNKKIILGMVIIAISALMLGSVIGFFVTREVLKTQVLNQMIKEGYVDTNLATATSEDIIYGKSAYVKGQLVNSTQTFMSLMEKHLIPAKNRGEEVTITYE